MVVIDLAVFALAVDEASFRAADHRMHVEFAHQRPGFLRRTTARAENGDWLVLTWWADSEAADAAAQAALANRVAQDFWTHVKPDSVRSRRFTVTAPV